MNPSIISIARRWALSITLVLSLLVLAACFLRYNMAQGKKPAPAEEKKPAAAEEQRPLAVAAPREQLRYQGKTFAEWRDRLTSAEIDSKTRSEAIKALIAFGLNGYAPEAAKALGHAMTFHYEDADHAFALRFVKAWGGIAKLTGSEEELAYQHMAMLGEPAVPVLLAALESNDPRQRDLAAIVVTGKPLDSENSIALPSAVSGPTSFLEGLSANYERLLHLARSKDLDTARLACALITRSAAQHESIAPLAVDLIDSADKDRRSLALSMLLVIADPHWSDSGDNKFVIYWISGEHAKPISQQAIKVIVPAVIRAMDDKDVKIQKKAVLLLEQYSSQAKEALPILIERLRQNVDEEDVYNKPDANGKKPDDRRSYAERTDSEGMRTAFVQALGGFGPDARDAIGLLKEIADKRYADRDKIIEALKRIDPSGKSVPQTPKK